MNVNKSTSNTAVWGDTGRYPLAIELTSQVYSYLGRLEGLDKEGCSSLVRHAYAEQRDLKLLWFSRLESTRSTVKQLSGVSDISNPLKISEAMKTLFVQQWNKEKKLNRKVGFYNLIKASFDCKTYLSINLQPNLQPQQTRRLPQLRTSSHQYNTETGRHGMHCHKLSNRACKHCSTIDVESLDLLLKLPFPDLIIEDELHVLRTCPFYEDVRHCLSPQSKTLLFSDIGQNFAHPTTIGVQGSLPKLMNEDSLKCPPNKFLTITILPNVRLGTLSEEFI